MTEITTILRKAVEEKGEISFARFMEIALYCPKFGYYEATEEIVGRGGDYFTSVSTGPLFGQLLAFQFSQWLEDLPHRRCQIVEAGAHGGRLAADILVWLQRERPNISQVLEYHVVEPSLNRQKWQRKRLESFADRVQWVSCLAELPPGGVHGIIFSNELLDAFPVHRLGWDAVKGQWFEWGVGMQGADFVWKKLSDGSATWTDELCRAGLPRDPELLKVLPEGFIVEVCPAARRWWKEAAKALHSGKLMTLDYGLTADQFLTPERAEGTLRAYREHRLNAHLLADPGHQDLTSHVNFTQLQSAGEAAGLRTECFAQQGQFLTAIAMRFWESDSISAQITEGVSRQFQMLTHPEHLGRSFRVLVQGTRNGLQQG